MRLRCQSHDVSADRWPDAVRHRGDVGERGPLRLDFLALLERSHEKYQPALPAEFLADAFHFLELEALEKARVALRGVAVLFRIGSTIALMSCPSLRCHFGCLISG